jgi:hypothetical protein
MELIDWGSPENAAEADTGDRDEAIAIARASVNELTNSGEMVISGAARVVDRLTGVPTEPGFVVNDIWLLRLRTLLARAQGPLPRLQGPLPRHGQNA